MLEQKVGEVTRGGVVKFPLRFASGIMRPRFNPADGQLYVAGLKGWQTNAGRDGCLQRVRYTGKPVYLPTGLAVGKDTLAVTFAVALDPNTAADAQNYSAAQWNYRWWAARSRGALPARLGHANSCAAGRRPLQRQAVGYGVSS